MKPENASNGASSATTSTSGHASAQRGQATESSMPNSRTPAAKLSEAAFLKRQAEDAKAAIAQSFSEMTAKLREGADPLVWARQYPWISLGVAAVAGFVGT